MKPACLITLESIFAATFLILLSKLRIRWTRHHTNDDWLSFDASPIIGWWRGAKGCLCEFKYPWGATTCTLTCPTGGATLTSTRPWGGATCTPTCPWVGVACTVTSPWCCTPNPWDCVDWPFAWPWGRTPCPFMCPWDRDNWPFIWPWGRGTCLSAGRAAGVTTSADVTMLLDSHCHTHQTTNGSIHTLTCYWIITVKRHRGLQQLHTHGSTDALTKSRQLFYSRLWTPGELRSPITELLTKWQHIVIALIGN